MQRLGTIMSLVVLLVACSRPVPDPLQPEAGKPRPPLPPPPEGCQAGEREPESLTISFTQHTGGTLIWEDYYGIVDYLSQTLGVPVKALVDQTVQEATHSLQTGEADIIWAAPLAYVRIKQSIPCLQLLLTQVSKGTTFYATYLVTTQESSIQTVDELQGKRMAFIHRNSTSGYLLAKLFLEGRGFDIEKDFSKIVFAGTHVEAVDLLLKGEVDVIATYSEVFRPARMEGKEVNRLRVLAITGRSLYDAVAAHPTLSPELTRKVAAAFARLNLTNPEGQRILGDHLEISGWVYTRDHMYDPLRALLREEPAQEVAR